MAEVLNTLSVVTVVLNDVSGLENTIKSIQRQESLTIEHIIVDGGSTDGSAKVAAKHSSKFVESMADGGIYPAMQRGAALATGEYLLFCNAGDLIFGVNYLSRAVDLLAQDNGAWGFGPIIELTQRNTFAWVTANTKANPSSIIARRDFVPFPSFIVKRDLFERIGGFTNKYKIAGDFELICKVAQQHTPLIFTEPLALFAAGGISYTQADLAWKEEVSIRKEMLKHDHLDSINEVVRFRLRIAKWKLGKFLDQIEKKYFKSSRSWRDIRSHKVPEVYIPELS
jgi:glycosyltransferase involved in cell wall biosynthesis